MPVYVYNNSTTTHWFDCICTKGEMTKTIRKEIKEGLEDLDKEKVMDFAKTKGAELKVKAEDLVDLAKEKGTPALKRTAEDVLNNVIKVSKEALKKLEK